MEIQMIGTQRSGSNLLRLMLHSHSAIHAPHPPHLLKHFMPLADRYQPADRDDNFRRLVDDMVTVVELNPVPWDPLPDREAIRETALARSVVGVFEGTYRTAARRTGKPHWCCKSLASFEYATELLGVIGPTLRFLYLTRDGRDVALSFQKAIVGEKHIYSIARQWHRDQQACLRLRDSLPASQFHTVYYEELIARPEGALDDLCRYLGIAMEPQMLEFHRSVEAERTASSSALWQNVTAPVLRNNSQKFRREMGAADVALFEQVAGRSLDALGYDRDQVARGDERPFSPAEVETFDRLNCELKARARVQFASDDDLERRERQEAFIRSIVERRPAAVALA